MSTIPIQRVHAGEEMPAPLLQSIQDTFEEIEKKAFRLYEERGCTHGSHVDDWLRAEREVVWAPHAGMIERDDEFRMDILVGGIDARNIKITATPESIIVHGEGAQKREKKGRTLQLVERTQKRLFRRFDLPSAIDVDHVTATVDKSTLCIRASKAGRAVRTLAAAA